MESTMFIKSIIIDETGRIIVSIQNQFISYLKDDSAKKLLRETTKKALGEDFKQLEVSSSTFRITVTDGNSEKCKVIVEKEITKSIEMALNFMKQMGGE